MMGMGMGMGMVLRKWVARAAAWAATVPRSSFRRLLHLIRSISRKRTCPNPHPLQPLPPHLPPHLPPLLKQQRLPRQQQQHLPLPPLPAQPLLPLFKDFTNSILGGTLKVQRLPNIGISVLVLLSTLMKLLSLCALLMPNVRGRVEALYRGLM